MRLTVRDDDGYVVKDSSITRLQYFQILGITGPPQKRDENDYVFEALSLNGDWNVFCRGSLAMVTEEFSSHTSRCELDGHRISVA